MNTTHEKISVRFTSENKVDGSLWPIRFLMWERLLQIRNTHWRDWENHRFDNIPRKEPLIFLFYPFFIHFAFIVCMVCTSLGITMEKVLVSQSVSQSVILTVSQLVSQSVSQSELSGNEMKWKGELHR